ncbi:MAG: hypothetical protein NVS1B1_01260 [Candidatus Limnocylindrales bacterium]
MTIAAQIGAGLIGGYIGTKVMEPASAKLYDLEPAADRKREDEVRPGSPSTIAARKTAARLGIALSDERAERLGTLLHYGLGAGGGAIYAVIRRTTDLHPLLAGLATGAVISLVFDEGLTPALGFSAPNDQYPAVTHVRGFAAHLVYGVSLAVAAEALGGLARVFPQR